MPPSPTLPRYAGANVRGLVPGGRTHTDQGEFVTLHWVSPAWLKAAVRSGEIRDRVVVAAVAYLLLEGEL